MYISIKQQHNKAIEFVFKFCRFYKNSNSRHCSFVRWGRGITIQWQMILYRSNFIGLSSAIANEIARTEYGCRQVKISITGIANAGIVVNVVDDNSLVELFDNNDPDNGFIHLQVDIDEVLNMSPSLDMN